MRKFYYVIRTSLYGSGEMRQDDLADAYIRNFLIPALESSLLTPTPSTATEEGERKASNALLPGHREDGHEAGMEHPAEWVPRVATELPFCVRREAPFHDF